MSKSKNAHLNFNENQFQYPIIEKVIISFAFSLIIIFLYLMLTNVSLRHLFFQTAEDELLSQPIGKVLHIQGSVSREKVNDTEFEKLKLQELLYPNDTVMTGSGGAIIIELNDGQKIVVEQNSLVKLNFDFDFSLSSLIPRQFLTQKTIKKQAEVKVQTKVGKEVKKFTEVEFKQKIAVLPIQKVVETAPPPIIPVVAPIKVVKVYNPENQVIKFVREDLTTGFKMLQLKFDLSYESLKIKLKVKRNKADFLAIQIPDKIVNAQYDLKITTPGSYVWEVFNKYGNVISTSQFIVDSMVEGEIIDGLTVTNASSKMDGLSTKSLFPGFQLNWNEFEKGTPYSITIKDMKANKILTHAKTTSTQYVFSKNKIIFDKKMSFKLEQTTKNGFHVSSKEYPFAFEYLPPNLAFPEKNKELSMQAFKGSQKKIFFTWTKTNYAQSYEFQYSNDEEFDDVLISKKLKDNFFVLTNPQEGTFYWRVKAIAEETASAYSKSNKLIIKE